MFLIESSFKGLKDTKWLLSASNDNESNGQMSLKILLKIWIDTTCQKTLYYSGQWNLRKSRNSMILHHRCSNRSRHKSEINLDLLAQFNSSVWIIEILASPFVHTWISQSSFKYLQIFAILYLSSSYSIGVYFAKLIE